MRMILESNSSDIFPSSLANDIFVYISFSVMVATTCFVIYALAGILAWSSNKPLPRVIQGSAFNILFVSSVMAIAFLLLRGTDLIGLFAMAIEPIMWIVEDYAPVVAVGLSSTIMVIVVKWVRTA
jgi:hypothetical protein